MLLYDDSFIEDLFFCWTQQAIGLHEDPLTIVRRCKLKRYEHVYRSSGLAKKILQGTVKWGRGQGRQKKRREDNIREWTDLGFAKSQRAAKNREERRKLVVKSSLVTQRPPWLSISGRDGGSTVFRPGLKPACSSASSPSSLGLGT